jgi:hypothetical protein
MGQRNNMTECDGQIRQAWMVNYAKSVNLRVDA